MFIWLTGTKIILYVWFLSRVWQKTPLSFLLLAIIAALLAAGFWRSFKRYADTKVNVFTLLLELILAALVSLFPNSAGFDKLFMIYLIEGTAVLPKPFSYYYALLAVAVGTGAFALSELRATGQLEMPGIAEIMLYGFAFILVFSERRQREQRQAYEKLSKELEYLNLQLNESLALSAQLASEAERLRIAGEIHDSLGHDLTGLILTLEAGKRLLNHDPKAARSNWDQALQVSRKALDSIRELVAEKRDPYFAFDLGARLREMTGEAEALTGLQSELNLNIQDPGLSSKEGFNLYRIFQEAITNTLRHAKAGRVRISVLGDREAVCFSYCDDGEGTNRIEAGNGLKGMQERIAELGGVLSFYSRPGKGFKIDGQIDRRRLCNEENQNPDC